MGLPAAGGLQGGFLEAAHGVDEGAARGALGLGQQTGLALRRPLDGQVGGGLQQQQLAQVGDHLAAELARVGAGAEGVVDGGQAVGAVAVEPGVGQGHDGGVGGRAQHELGLLQGDEVVGGHDELVEQAFGVAQTARALPSDEVDGRRFDGQPFLSGQPVEAAGDLRRGQQAKVELLAAGFDGQGDFVLFGGGQDEDGVGRRFFERLEQGVEGGRGEHVDFVDDVDFVAAVAGGEVDLVAQVADVVDAGIAGGVDLDQVEEAGFVDGQTDGTAIVGAVGGVLGGAVDGLGQQAGHGGLARATRAAKEVGVTHAADGDAGLQRVGDVFLADDLVEPGRSPFAIEGL